MVCIIFIKCRNRSWKSEQGIWSNWTKYKILWHTSKQICVYSLKFIGVLFLFDLHTKNKREKTISKHKYNFENFTQETMISTILLHFWKIVLFINYWFFEGKSTEWLTSHNHTSMDLTFNLIYPRYLASIIQM